MIEITIKKREIRVLYYYLELGHQHQSALEQQP
jgi:hypothetical protein